jgi:hypothetical protein
MKNFIALFLALATLSANAAVIDIDYEWDGTTFYSLNGNNLFGTNLAVGDTLNLSFTGIQGNAWDFSAIGVEGNVNLGFDVVTSCGTKSSSGEYSAFFGGVSLLQSTYNSTGQSCIHAGPDFDSIDFSGIDTIDNFNISYVLNSSTTTDNIIASYADVTWWQIWELFGMTENNIVINDPTVNPAPAPATILFLGLSLLAVFKLRKR